MARSVTERADIVAPLAEVFRRYGFEGASLALIGEATGLGKGSLYHFFPGGKAEMAAAVLAEVDGWFEAQVYAPLRTLEDPEAALGAMFDAVAAYFQSGRRVCLMGVLAMGDARDRFGTAIADTFSRWIAALAMALRRQGHGEAAARRLAEEAVAEIQGAIVLSRALDDPALFERVLGQLRGRMSKPRS